ncbi:hypothetical protein, partial [Caballeronia terrestris]|uniref:hypothetical protein n=1 Tax=Caballeronia terrestris TaxID=1226301 RepID=UPI001F48C146
YMSARHRAISTILGRRERRPLSSIAVVSLATTETSFDPAARPRERRPILVDDDRGRRPWLIHINASGRLCIKLYLQPSLVRVEAFLKTLLRTEKS